MTKLNWEKARKRDLLRKPKASREHKGATSAVGREKQESAARFALGMFRASTLAKLKELEVEEFGRSLSKLGTRKLTEFVRLLAEHPKTRCALQSLSSGEADFSFTAFDFGYAKSLLRWLAEKKPNQSLEPTRVLGTSAAEPPRVPSTRVAHL